MRDVEIVVADTEAARRLHYHLRYQVFCLETKFEDASKYPDEQEKDEFDGRAEHFLVRNRHSGGWLATARLIFPGDSPLPIERNCSLDGNASSFSQMAEFSRLLIASPVRRRRRGSESQWKDASVRHIPPSFARPEAQWILSKLVRAMAAYGLERDIPGAAFFITPALARILTRMKVELTVIGAPCQHRGVRFPYVADAKQVFKALSRIIEHHGGYDEPKAFRLFSELYGSENPRTLEERTSDHREATYAW